MTTPLNARAELREYVHLLADSWTPRKVTDERVERLYAVVRAEVLREAADLIDRTYTGPDKDQYARYAANLLRRTAAVPAA
jgi:hypothetical protein